MASPPLWLTSGGLVSSKRDLMGQDLLSLLDASELRPQPDPPSSSYDNVDTIGITVERVDPPDNSPPLISSGASSASTIPLPYTPDDPPDQNRQHFQYNSGQIGHADAPGVFSTDRSFLDSNDPVTYQFVGRSPRLSTSRGRQISRRPLNIHLPSGFVHRQLSPLGLDIPRRPLSAGPYTEPIITETFNWPAPQDSALLSPLSLSSLGENRRKRSSSFRSLRGTDISRRSGPIESPFLSIPGVKNGPTRQRSTSVPPGPTASFYSTVLPTFNAPFPTTVPPSSTTSPSTSHEGLQDPIGSGSIPSSQLDFCHLISLPSSHQPSPESPLSELDGPNMYTHPNSSASSHISRHSASSLAFPFRQPPSSDTDFVAFDLELDATHSEGVPFHGENVGRPSISVTDVSSSSAHQDFLLSTNDLNLEYLSGSLGALDPAILDDPLMNSGQGQIPSLFGTATESGVAPSPATPDMLSPHALSTGDPFFNLSPQPGLEYENSCFDLSAFTERSTSRNSFHDFAGAASYTLPGPSGSHDRTSQHDLGQTENDPFIISRRLCSQGWAITPHSTPCHSHPGTTYPRISSSERSIVSSHDAHLNSISHPNPVAVGGASSTSRTFDIPLLSPYISQFPDPLAITNLEGQGVSSPSTSGQKPARLDARNSSDPQFQAKKYVFKVLAESTSKDKALAKITELASKPKFDLIRSVFDDAAQRKVKSTPASQQRARQRRSRLAAFFCILCHGEFTTNNNLQNHYRSHLRMDQYRCPRCGEYFRTEGIRKRHTDGAQKCLRLDAP